MPQIVGAMEWPKKSFVRDRGMISRMRILHPMLLKEGIFCHIFMYDHWGSRVVLTPNKGPWRKGSVMDANLFLHSRRAVPIDPDNASAG